MKPLIQLIQPIRKKFVKDPIKNDEPVSNTSVIKGKEEDLRTLTERNNDLEKRLALATVEYEEMELQKVQYLKDISKLEDNIENFVKTENKLIKENEELKSNVVELTTDIEEPEEKNKTLDSEKDELNDRVDELCRELHGKKVISDNKTYVLENKLSKTQNDLKEATDNALIYEHTLKNKELEINLLNSKLSSVSNCENCGKKCICRKGFKGAHGSKPFRRRCTIYI